MFAVSLILYLDKKICKLQYVSFEKCMTSRGFGEEDWSKIKMMSSVESS